MSIVKLALIAAFAFTTSISVGSVVTKGKPGKCGVGKYYSKKDKGCLTK
jgi:hypothetical protein